MSDTISTKVYAARVSDKPLLNRSSSGGMFTPLSDYVLDGGGAVACSVYDYGEHRTKFKLITDKSQRDAALGSKYVQSLPGDIFKQCENWLKANPNGSLMFVGMGCQADGFRSFAKARGFLHRVYIVDIVCHGSPSPRLWEEYARSLESKHGGKIEYLTFKDKRNGWIRPTAFAKINGDEISLLEYVKTFYSSCCLRPSCHECPYTTMKRKTDITIGDFWGIDKAIPEFYSAEGNSLVLIHTQKGSELFESIKGRLEVKASSCEQCVQPNLVKPTEKSPLREKFWSQYHANGADYVIKKYGNDTFVRKVKKKLKSILNGGAK